MIRERGGGVFDSSGTRSAASDKIGLCRERGRDEEVPCDDGSVLPKRSRRLDMRQRDPSRQRRIIRAGGFDQEASQPAAFPREALSSSLADWVSETRHPLRSAQGSTDHTLELGRYWCTAVRVAAAWKEGSWRGAGDHDGVAHWSGLSRARTCPAGSWAEC